MGKDLPGLSKEKGGLIWRGTNGTEEKHFT